MMEAEETIICLNQTIWSYVPKGTKSRLSDVVVTACSSYGYLKGPTTTFNPNSSHTQGHAPRPASPHIRGEVHTGGYH
jgi:hypothetical protein